MNFVGCAYNYGVCSPACNFRTSAASCANTNLGGCSCVTQATCSGTTYCSALTSQASCTSSGCTWTLDGGPNPSHIPSAPTLSISYDSPVVAVTASSYVESGNTIYFWYKWYKNGTYLFDTGNDNINAPYPIPQSSSSINCQDVGVACQAGDVVTVEVLAWTKYEDTGGNELNSVVGDDGDSDKIKKEKKKKDDGKDQSQKGGEAVSTPQDKTNSPADQKSQNKNEKTTKTIGISKINNALFAKSGRQGFYEVPQPWVIASRAIPSQSKAFFEVLRVEYSPPASIEITIGEVVQSNNPPSIISVSLSPDIVYKQTRITGTVTASDPDLHNVRLEEEWKDANGVVIAAGSSSPLPSSPNPASFSIQFECNNYAGCAVDSDITYNVRVRDDPGDASALVTRTIHINPNPASLPDSPLSLLLPVVSVIVVSAYGITYMLARAFDL
ncbi:hypothetical protein FJZ26_00950 [Candidatus Parvarchaeota archaeon]|nr:hypothetical protein [Candidatus Parvarchaeota archaeon]